MNRLICQFRALLHCNLMYLFSLAINIAIGIINGSSNPDNIPLKCTIIAMIVVSLVCLVAIFFIVGLDLYKLELVIVYLNRGIESGYFQVFPSPALIAAACC